MLQTAINAAKTAGKILIDQRSQFQIDDIVHKEERDFVTNVDLLSEKTIIDIIQQKFPDHAFLAEESGEKTTDAAYCWIIDPLDGTTNYIHNYPMYSVSIALQKDDETILGVVYDPVRDELFTAEKGKGAYLNQQPIHVSGIETPKLSLLATGFPFRHQDLLDRYLEVFRSLFAFCSDMRRGGSAAIDLAHVACGRLDGYWEFKLLPWDLAAGSLIVEEAGGRVSEMDGSNTYLQSGNILATNTYLHNFILEKIEQSYAVNIS